MKSTIPEKNLQYILQSNESYTVKSESGRIFAIAKAYSRDRSTRRSYDFHAKWMQMAAFGLPLGGIPTVILSPLVFWRNVTLLKHANLNQDERIHAKHLVVVSVIFFLLALVFFALFIMHLIY